MLGSRVGTEPYESEISKKKESGPVKRLSFLVLFLTLSGLASCGYKPVSTAVTCSTTTSTSSTTSSTSTCTDPLTNISVTISPATVSVAVVTTQQFLVAIIGGTNSVAIWQVNGTTGGNDTVGRIDSNGLYHAPAIPPSPNTVSVTAVSFEDQKVSATSTVTITPAPVVTITSPTSPPTVASGSANTVNFTATETGGTTNVILWYVGPVGGLGVLGGNATFGTISASGVYTPPLTPPIGQTVAVTAVAQDSPNSTASLIVTISGYSTSSLQGQFAFSLTGTNAAGRFVRAGSFVADGAGNLNSVLEDANGAAGATSAPISATGTYTVRADGRGTMQLDDGLTPASFDFVLVNGTQLRIIGFDGSGTATGRANAQDISTFGLSSLSGTYVFGFSGSHNGNGLSEIGEFTADGAGHITGGSIDVNDNGAVSQLQITGNTAPVGQPPVYPSIYTAAALPNGRGTLTLATSGATLHFSFYVVSRGAAKFIGADSETAVGAVEGATIQQAPNATFDTTSLNGNYAFFLSGSGSGGRYAAAGSFSADGQGHVTSAVLDENLNGTPNSNVVLSGLTYSVSANGRGTLAFSGGRTYVFYIGPVGTAVLQETDSNNPNIADDGIFQTQQNASFSVSQLTGTYALATSGLSGASSEVIVGEIAAAIVNGTPSIPSGNLDVNTAGATTTGVAIAAGSTYAASSSAERGTLTLNLASPLSQTRNFAIYVVGLTDVYIVEIDSGIVPSRLAAGMLLRQF
jgi:hypothetical protein